MKNVYLSQVNNTYGKNAFLPYSVGLLQAYALKNQTICDNFDFKGFIYLREPLDEVMSRLEHPDVFGLSCYIWNWNYSTSLAKYVKSMYPNCLIVLGGPHVPNHEDLFFQTHPYVDILVHYEGEITFSEILLERLKNSPDYSQINGISINIDGKLLRTSPRSRMNQLDEIPSPYLCGIFDQLIQDPYDFHASQESNRGCPFSCSFCDWGSNILAKVKAFSTERLIDELQWFADHKIDLIYNCDANFGILPRDIDLVKKMVEMKKQFGFPNKFRAAYAKNSNETVHQIAKILNEANMNKGITLSFQSMNDETLKIVKRKNIKIDNFKEIMKQYRIDNIATYSEIIIGLPGETYDSFANGLNTLIDCGQHESIQIYNCEVLPNSEMNSPEYKKLHDIKTTHTPVLFFHGTPSKDPYQEYYDLVISTAALPHKDWLKCHQLSWIIQCLHCLSLTQCIAVFANSCGINYRTFYESLLDFANNYPQTQLGQITKYVTELFEGISQGKEWGIVDDRFGNIVWPPEEGAFLKLIINKDLFYEEIKPHVKLADNSVLDDVFTYQKAMVISPFQEQKIKIELSCDLHKFLQQSYLGNDVQLIKEPVRYEIKAQNYQNLEEYAREVVWYNRKGGKFLYSEVSYAS